MLSPTPSPATEPADFVRARPAITRAVWEALAPELQAKAFFITGVECIATVARVRDLAASLPEGGDYKEIKDQITAEISPYLVTSTDPEERAKQQAAAARRAEVILRMQGFQAYARTQDAMLRAHIDAFPYCVYLASPDDRVRPAHAALHGKIIPTDHPFWDTHTPPWEFGCRCDKAGMSGEEVAEIRAAEAGKAPEDQRVLGPEQLRQLTEHDRLVAKGGAGFIDVRTPRQKRGTGYEWRVQDEATTVDQVLENLPLADQQAFEELAGNTELSDGRTLLEWWRPGKGRAKATGGAAGKKKDDGKNRKDGKNENPTDPTDPADLEEVMGSVEKALSGRRVLAAVASPTELLPPAVLTVLLARENAIRHSLVEDASLFRRGVPRLDVAGTATTVPLPLDMKTQDGIFTHVHPGGFSFSVEDLEQLFTRRLSEVRAITRHGNYSIFPTEARGLGKIIDRYEALAPVIRAALRKAPGKRTRREKDLAQLHALWIQLAKENLIHYSYTPMTPQNPILDALAAPEEIVAAPEDMADCVTPYEIALRKYSLGLGPFPYLAEARANHLARLAAGLEE